MIKSNFKNIRFCSTSLLNDALDQYKNKCISRETPNDIMDIIHNTYNKAGFTLEVISGRLMKYGRASLKHNITTSNLNGLFYNFCKKNNDKYITLQDCTIDYNTDPKAELTHDIVVLKCSPSNSDLFLMSGSTMKMNSSNLPVKIVVEALSPDSGRKDRTEARLLCEKRGYPYYWLIDPLKYYIKIYKYNELIKKYNEPITFIGDDIIYLPELDMEIKLSDVFSYKK